MRHEDRAHLPGVGFSWMLKLPDQQHRPEKGTNEDAATATTPGCCWRRESTSFTKSRPFYGVIAIVGSGEVEGAGEDALGTEAGIDLLELPEAGEKHSGSGEEYEGEGDLGADEDGAQALFG